MPIEVGAANNLPAFNEHLKGVRPGVSVEFRVEYPPKYGARSLAGKAVAYTIRVHEVKRRDVPDLDDELARGLGEADLGSLRERVRAKLLAHREQEGERETRQALLDKVLIENPVALPDVLVEREIRRRLEQIVQSVILQGVDPGKAELDWKELRKRQEEPARKAVHARLILDAVGQAQKLQVAPDEVDARIREEAHRVGEAPEKLRARLREHGGMEGLTGQLVREKSLDYLTSVANIQYSE
jgi:trigger factor